VKKEGALCRLFVECGWCSQEKPIKHPEQNTETKKQYAGALFSYQVKLIKKTAVHEKNPSKTFSNIQTACLAEQKRKVICYAKRKLAVKQNICSG
jgi:hypothetical protein